MACNRPRLAIVEADSSQELLEGKVYRRYGTDGALRRFSLHEGKLMIRSDDAGRVQHATMAEPAGQVLRLGRRALPIVSLLELQGLSGVFEWQGFIARSPAMCVLLSRLASAAFSDAPVLVHGESGSGKELVARALHALSPRREGPFVAINCAALPESLAEAELFGARRGAYTGAQSERIGAFGQADGGTLFLDEVGELPYRVQGKLLRALEEGEVRPLGATRSTPFSLRVVSATWRDLNQEAEEGAFRFDLLQRLAVLELIVPALRERPEDVAPLLAVALQDHRALDLWPAEVDLRRLERHPWPGNVRQLKNIAHRAAVWGEPVKAPKARPRLQQGAAYLSELPKHRRALVAIDRFRGNRSAAARALGVSRSTLYRWLSPRGAAEARRETQSPVDTRQVPLHYGHALRGWPLKP